MKLVKGETDFNKDLKEFLETRQIEGYLLIGKKPNGEFHITWSKMNHLEKVGAMHILNQVLFAPPPELKDKV